MEFIIGFIVGLTIGFFMALVFIIKFFKWVKGKIFGK
jgi:hypothetical protein